MPNPSEPDPAVPTSWTQRGARIAGQTGLSAARFLRTRMRSFASPDRAQEFVAGFHQQTAQQLVEMLGEMKGAAMKLGQLASFYEFASPGDHMSTYRDALTMLQNAAPPMDPSASRGVIEREFERPVEEVFEEFDDVPVAAASIGQVHRARLPSGESVAVKVQYPGVDEAVRSDLKNLNALAKISVAVAPNLDPKEVANEVRDRVLEELDYRREAGNQARFAELYEDHPYVVVPRVFEHYSRTRVLTQEFIEGAAFPTAYDWDQPAKDRLGEILFRFFYGSLNRFRLFSADPHPGNYLLLDDGRVAFLDFGLVRAVDPGTLALLIEIVQALIAEDRQRGRKALEGLGILNARTPEIEAVWDHLKMLNAAILTDGDFTISTDFAREIAAAGMDPRSSAFQTLRKVGVPGVMVTFNRMSFGVVSLLARLEATANWHAIAHELWSGEGTAAGEIARAEQEWLKVKHPDLKPALD